MVERILLAFLCDTCEEYLGFKSTKLECKFLLPLLTFFRLGCGSGANSSSFKLFESGFYLLGDSLVDVF